MAQKRCCLWHPQAKSIHVSSRATLKARIKPKRHALIGIKMPVFSSSLSAVLMKLVRCVRAHTWDTHNHTHAHALIHKGAGGGHCSKTANRLHGPLAVYCG